MIPTGRPAPAKTDTVSFQRDGRVAMEKGRCLKRQNLVRWTFRDDDQKVIKKGTSAALMRWGSVLGGSHGACLATAVLGIQPRLDVRALTNRALRAERLAQDRFGELGPETRFVGASSRFAPPGLRNGRPCERYRCSKVVQSGRVLGRFISPV